MYVCMYVCNMPLLVERQAVVIGVPVHVAAEPSQFIASRAPMFDLTMPALAVPTLQKRRPHDVTPGGFGTLLGTSGVATDQTREAAWQCEEKLLLAWLSLTFMQGDYYNFNSLFSHCFYSKSECLSNIE